MIGDVMIEVAGLAKKYCPALRRSLVYAAFDIAGEAVPALRRRQGLRRGEFWALRDIGFEVRRGEAVALIGHNGAGKSTLLKVIHGLLKANAGSVRVRGKVVALIELGAGINPILSARENVVLVGQLHGLSRSAAKALIPDVLEFAELQHVADVAVQTYSSGMRARLSYAIAAILRADVLFVDEVLAVGDLAFQRKCIRHMQRFVADGGTLLLVSHAPQHVQSVCSRAILLEKGRIVAEGDPAQVVRRYLELRPIVAPVASENATTPADFRIDALAVTDGDGGTARNGEDAVIRLGYHAMERVTAYLGVQFWTQDGWTCITSCFDMTGRTIEVGSGVLECHIARMPLVAGCYIARPLVADRFTLVPIQLDGPAHAGATFEVTAQTDLLSNGQMQMAQLVTMEAQWIGVPSDAPAEPAGLEAMRA